ncbi:capsular polysaccharide export protein, LipB/KpsS family [Flavobacterium sp.]|uniref:capsular polysaccharide export protein, LipB/KpsS family n=1 Tax=Flavobacterium sp. TaxID=239 RepID=UPI0040477885
MINICLFGFAKSYELISLTNCQSDWYEINSVIIPTNTYITEWKTHFDKAKIYDLTTRYSNISDTLPSARAIDSNKRKFNNKTGEYKLKYYASIRSKLHFILKEETPNLILFPQAIETPDAIILIEVAKELKIPVAVPNGARFLGGSFWSDSYYEKLCVKNNDNIVINFSSSQLPFVFEQPKPKYIPPSYSKQLRSLIQKLSQTPIDIIKVRLINRFPFLFNFKRPLRRYYYDKISTKDLPQNFVYYPLQYTPESSINVPNPYYVDQLRSIDEIRYSLPKNTILIIKEHPAKYGLRDVEFYKNVLKRSHVKFVDITFTSKELINKSICTVSITGTAALEAFIYKKPSILLGNSFFSKVLINCLNDLQSNNLKTPTDSYILDSIKEISSYLFDFNAVACDYYNTTEIHNVNIFNLSLKKFYFEYC